jgi:hypothetical protein
MLIAEISGNTILNMGSYPDGTVIPSHKASYLKVVQGASAPSYNSNTEVLIGPSYAVSNGVVSTVWSVEEKDLETFRTAKLEALWTYAVAKMEAAVVPVSISGVAYDFGCDREARENIMGILQAISIGLPVDNPKYWSPRNAVSPVLCTHDELKTIGGSILVKKDVLMQTYFMHRAFLMSYSTISSIDAYDFTGGW